MKKDFLNTKKDGFKLPDNYFSKFEDRLFDSVSEKSDFHLPKSDGFQVPENYFDNLEKNIFSKIEKEQQNRSKVRKLKVFKYAISSVAAAMIIALSIINFQPKTSEDQLNKLSATEVENYINDGYLSPYSYDIGELFSDEISDLSMTSSIDDEAIIDYLVTYEITEEP